MKIIKETNYRRNFNFKVLRTEQNISDEEYNAKMRAIRMRAKKMRAEKFERLSKLRREKFMMIQYHQKLMLEAPNDREFERLQEITQYMTYELRDIDAELKELAAKM